MTMTTTVDDTINELRQKLLPYDLQEESSGEWRCNNPFVPNSNSHALHIKIERDALNLGVYTDFAHSMNGGVTKLCNELNVSLPNRTKIEPTKHSYRDIEEYAAAHGLPKYVLVGADWSPEVTRVKDNRPALTFQTEGGMRYRFLDGAFPAYKSVYGFKPCLYRLRQAVLIAQEYNWDELILDNGEIATLAGQHYLVPAFCQPGGEKPSMPPQLIAQIKALWNKGIVVAFDCDKTGREAAEGMVKTLTAAGIPARAVDLGLSTGGDLADLCKLHGASVGEVVKRLPPLNGANYAKTEKPGPSTDEYEFIHSNDLDGLPDSTYLIPGMVIENGLNMLFGPSGVGKSFIVLDWALQIAQTQPVIYVAREAQNGYKKRVKAWETAHGKSRAKLFMGFKPISLFDEVQVNRFIAGARKIAPKLIVFDTLARCSAGADENSTRDMNIIVEHCDIIREALGCAVLIVHHTAKGSKIERGSSALRGAMDSAVYVEKDDDLIRIESDKLKDDDNGKPLAVKLVHFANSVVPMPVDRTALKVGEALSPAQYKILDFLAMEIWEVTGARSNKIKDEAQVTGGSFYRSLNVLVKLGYIEQSRKGEPYRITDLGRAMLK